MASPLLISGARTQSATCAPALASTARPWATSAVLLLGDTLALMAAGYLGYFLWSQVNNSIGIGFFFQLAPALAVSLVIYASAGLYPAAGIGPVEELRRVTLSITAVCLVSIAAIFFSKDADLYSRGVLLTSWLAAVVLAPLQRALVRALFSSRPWWGVPVLVLGAGDAGRMLAASLGSNPRCGLKPVAYLSDDPETDRRRDDGVEVAGPLSSAAAIATSLRVKQAIIAIPRIEKQQLLDVVERLGAPFTRLIIVPDMFGIATLWISPKDLAGVLGLEVRQNLLMPINRFWKRILDLAIGAALGLLALPLIAVAAFWIKRVSPGPAFYMQEREGWAGSRLRVWKLRTMHVNAEALLLDHLRADPEAQREWRRCFKLKKDPRVIPLIGALLRRSSLDELPQLWSVLKGEMSLVGPRPFPYYHLEQFGPSFRALRRRVLPGLTGLWQVDSRSDGDLRAQETLDTYYIRNWSVWLDLHILARTVHTVVSGKGAC